MSQPPAAATFDQFRAQLESSLVVEPAACPPAQSWPMRVAAALFDGQDGAVAAVWARRVHGEFDRLGGRVPFSVVHDWHAHTVAPMLLEVCRGRGEDGGAQLAVQQLHARALAGESLGTHVWTAALRPALREVYRYAYGYAEAYATAYASAEAYATANDYSEAEIIEFAAGYAKLNTTANVQSFADANAIANAEVMAAAYARADGQAYAESYPNAQVHAYALAHANPAVATAPPVAPDGGAAGLAERRQAAYARLADGWVDCLSRAVA